MTIVLIKIKHYSCREVLYDSMGTVKNAEYSTSLKKRKGN